MSIVYYVRALSYSSMKRGNKAVTLFLSGKHKVNMDIEHHGTEPIKANDGNTYICIKLVFMINDKAFDDKKEAMTVYITNNNSHVRVRIDSKLKIGSTQVILKNIKGNKHIAKPI